MDIIRKVDYIFDKKQKIRLFVLMIVMLIGSFLELLGIAAVLPLVSIISDPTQIHTRRRYSFVYDMLGFSDDMSFIVAFSMAIILLFILKNAYIILMNNLQFRFTSHNLQRFSCIMMDCYMRQPYLFHVSKNIAELSRNVSADVSMLFATVLAVIQLANESTVCLLLLIYLFVLDKYITLGLIIMLATFSLFFLKVVKKKAAAYGIISRDLSVEQSKWIRQGFEGIKEIKIVNREQFYIDNMNYYGTKAAEISIKWQTLNSMPRPLFEAACISSLLGVVTLKIANGADVKYFIPILSAFAVAAFRLLPSAGRITTFITSISYNKAAVDNVYKDLQEIRILQEEKKENCNRNSQDIYFDKEIIINKVTFNYPLVNTPVLQNASFTIRKNKSVALIGPSGAGKTTMADIVLGLLEPNEGQVLCDGIDVYENLDSWHKMLGYVPQTIYLIDDSIRSNILFGVPDNEADDDKVWRALENAQLADFVRGLEQGLDTVVGERGVRLSGGQRQRIGIARALYNEPEILVLDEATSSLDNETEQAVMEAIDSMHGSITILIIAHRLSTIKNCDYIYEISEKTANLKDKNEIFVE